jgi:hypothetical protein
VPGTVGLNLALARCEEPRENRGDQGVGGRVGLSCEHLRAGTRQRTGEGHRHRCRPRWAGGAGDREDRGLDPREPLEFIDAAESTPYMNLTVELAPSPAPFSITLPAPQVTISADEYASELSG